MVVLVVTQDRIKESFDTIFQRFPTHQRTIEMIIMSVVLIESAYQKDLICIVVPSAIIV